MFPCIFPLFSLFNDFYNVPLCKGNFPSNFLSLDIYTTQDHVFYMSTDNVLLRLFFLKLSCYFHNWLITDKLLTMLVFFISGF